MTSTERVPPRNTKQRSRIRAAVTALASFATAQDIHDRMRHDGSAVGLATVYRTLQTMAAAGELDAIRTPDGQVAYRICSPGHHHHLICRSCGRTEEVDLPPLERLISGMATEHGFASVDHEVEFFGLCATCAK